MGCSGFNQIIENKIIELDNDLIYQRRCITQLNDLIESAKDDILTEIDEKDDFKIKNKILEYIEQLNKKQRITNIKNLINDKKEELQRLLNEKKSEKEKLDKIKEAEIEINQAKEGFNIDYNHSKRNIIIDFCKLNHKIILEKKNIKNRKTNFIKNYDSTPQYSFPYPTSLQDSLKNNKKNIKNSFHNLKNDLKSYCQQIKKIIKSFLSYKFDENKTQSKYKNLSKKLEDRIAEQNKIETQALNQKNIDIENALINFRKNDIKSKLEDLRNSLKKTENIDNSLNNNIQECNKVINYLNSRNNEINRKYCFNIWESKKKEEKLITLKNNNDDLNSQKTSLNYKISELSKVNNSFVSLNQNCMENDYKKFNMYEESQRKIQNLKTEIEKKIKNVNGDSEKLIISNINSQIKNIKNNDLDIILPNSFYNQADNSDQIYNMLRKQEEEILTKVYHDKRKNIENIILDSKEIKGIQSMSNNIIKKILSNEESEIFFKNKIIKEIEEITNDDKKCSIDYLTILLVGRKGVGKTTLINYILELNEGKKLSSNNNSFIEYTSNKIKYIRLIESTGIGYVKGINDPITMKTKIKNYIDNLANSVNKNFNSVVHCIWHCISDSRILENEQLFFNSLKEVYKDNTMPIIFVHTNTTIEDEANKLKEKLLKTKNIDNSFVITMAKDMNLANGKIKQAFGREELIKTTLIKCTEALGSDLLKMMIQQISKSIKNNLINENQSIKEKIIRQTKKEFFENYNEALDCGDFIQYIIDIFFKYLNEFYDKGKKITNKSKNLIRDSDFISSIKNIYSSYQTKIKGQINPVAEEKSKKLIQIQTKLEKQNENMKLENRRNLNEFKTTTEIFLKKNYYFMAQYYIIDYIISSDIHFTNFLSLISNELNNIIRNILNLNDNNSNYRYIKQYLEYCYSKKLDSFYKNSSLSEIGYNNQEQLLIIPPSKPAIDKKNNFTDEVLKYPFKNSKSLIFNKNQKSEYNSIEKTMLNNNWINIGEHNWQFLNNEMKYKLKSFLKEVKYQDFIFDTTNKSKSFNFLQNEIKNDLINFFNDNISNYFNELLSIYDNKFSNINFENNEIEDIIKRENIEYFYRNKINEILIEQSRKNNLKNLDYISIIITGKSGIGKSKLINCLLKEEVAKTDVLDVITLKTEKYQRNFLCLFDTRGYELNNTYDPETIKKEVLKTIENNNNQNNVNDFIQCIWYCVSSSGIDNSEIKALKELKNNKFNLPVIVVFTKAINQDEINELKNTIKKLFQDLKFIPILAEGTPDIESYGLDDLLNTTFKEIKSSQKNKAFELIKDESKEKTEKEMKNILEKVKADNINELVKEFINDYASVLNETKFNQYIYDLFGKLIKKFSGKNELKEDIKLLLTSKNNIIDKNIKSYINLYSIITKNYINKISEAKSLEYLDFQVRIEKLKNESILPRLKCDRENFKEIISAFLMDNFYYASQKYLIEQFLKEIEKIIEQFGQNIFENLKSFLSSEELVGDYYTIYMKMFEDYEEKVNKFRDKNGNLYK